VPRLATARIHQASELNARYRQILDEAKASGVARLRDSDGTSIVIVPESEIAELESMRGTYDVIARAVRGFLVIETAVRDDRRPEGLELGDWPWLREFDLDDFTTFVADLRLAISEAVWQLEAAPIVDVLTGWRKSADALNDPLSRDTLLGHSTAHDYVEARRPE
jgi:hypothetical protein